MPAVAAASRSRSRLNEVGEDAEAKKAERPQRRLLFAPASAPPGPENLADVLQILKGVAQNLVAAGTEHGLDLGRPATHPGAVGGGGGGVIYMTTNYSGWGSAEMAGGQARRHLLRCGMHVPQLVMHSATDIQPRCRLALQSHKSDTAPRHVLHDVLDRIPADLRRKLTCAAAEHRRIITEQFLETQAARGAQAAVAERKAAVRSRGAEYVDLCRQELSQVTFSREQRHRCDVHGRRCPTAPPARKEDFWLEVAGATGIPKQSSSRRVGSGGKSPGESGSQLGPNS